VAESIGPKGGSGSRVAGRGRRWVFRLAAVLLGLAPLGVAEGVLRSLDLGRPDLSNDPFVGFSTLWPLFVPDATGERHEIPPAHHKFFRPASFPKAKPPREFRIFALGGSTVQGRPFATETAFTAWLEIGLNALDPSRDWRVVNCGGVSYASYRLTPILNELLDYQPDLFLICTGHNEFLEARSYAAVKELPGAVRRPLALVSRLRTYQLLRRLVPPPEEEAAPPASLGPEVQALLDYKGGLEVYRRDDAWREQVVAHFAFNLRRMVGAARSAGVPVVLMNPVSNLDHPPFKSEHREGLSAAEIDAFDGLLDEARGLYATDLPGAVLKLKAALAIDGRHAGLLYNLAKCYQALGRHDEARSAFVQARDEDVCPLRIISPMNRAVLDVAGETGTTLFDVDAFFAARSRHATPGGDWLVDHVHPSINGHRAWADALIDLLARKGFAEPDPDRRPERDRRDREHLASLDPAYFLIGQKRLGNLRLWAEGRGNLDPRPGQPLRPLSLRTVSPPTPLDETPRSE